MTTPPIKRFEFCDKLEDWKLFPTCKRKEHPPNCGCLKPFIRTSVLKDWMRKKEPGSDKANGVLLFEEIKPIQRHPHPSPSTILESCTIVFGWLVGARNGELIQNFYDAGFDDSKLRNPSYTLKGHGSNGTLRTALFKHAEHDPYKYELLIRNLERSRWEFCPFTLVPNMDNETFGNKLYMPFCRQWSVAELGGTADVYLALIQEEFVSDEPGFKKRLGPWVIDPEYGKCYKLAVKSISGDQLSTYIQERQAFVGIRDKPGMLRCLGFYSFTKQEHDMNSIHNEHDDDEHYNILLEYAEKNLDELFRQDPPQLAEDIHSQWQDLCHISGAIETLHDFEHDGARWSGWHGDIKPRNLLLVGGEWKLADYGFAVFHPKSDGKTKASLNERTETFGAPETVNADDVLQTVDTWSFGCVLSIAATWMVKGHEGVLQYQEYRSQIAKKVRHEDHPPDAFHDGVDVLPHIKVWHTHLRQLTRRSDHVTNKILSLVDDWLLKKERLTSKQLRLALDEIMNQTRGLSTSAPLSASSLDNELLDFLKAHSNKPHKCPTPQVNGFPASRGLPSANEFFYHVSPAREPGLQHSESPTVIEDSPLQMPILSTRDVPQGALPPVASIETTGTTRSSDSGLDIPVLPGTEIGFDFGSCRPTTFTGLSRTVAAARKLSGMAPISVNGCQINHEPTEAIHATVRRAHGYDQYLYIPRPHQEDIDTISTGSPTTTTNSSEQSATQEVRLPVQKRNGVQISPRSSQDPAQTPGILPRSSNVTSSDLDSTQRPLDGDPEDDHMIDFPPPPVLLSPITSNSTAAAMKKVWRHVNKANKEALEEVLTSNNLWIAEEGQDTRTPIMIAAINNFLGIVNLLVEHSDMSGQDSEQKTLLHHLFMGHHGNGKPENQEFLQTLEKILHHKPSPPEHDGYGRIDWSDRQGTCLLLCAQYDMPNAAKLLLDHGAAVDGTGTHKDDAPLIEAMKWGKHRVVLVLLDKPATRHLELLRNYKDRVNHVGWKLIETKLAKLQQQKSSPEEPVKISPEPARTRRRFSKILGGK